MQLCHQHEYDLRFPTDVDVQAIVGGQGGQTIIAKEWPRTSLSTANSHNNPNAE